MARFITSSLLLASIVLTAAATLAAGLAEIVVERR
jgi:hypothetical protein